MLVRQIITERMVELLLPWRHPGLYEASPVRYVRSEQRSQGACGPQPGGARRRAGICGVAAPRRCHYIACVAAPCICPPGARAKMHTLFPDGPLPVECSAAIALHPALSP